MIACTDPAEIDLARQLNDTIGADQAALVWPLVADAALVCRCRDLRVHLRGRVAGCEHSPHQRRPGGYTPHAFPIRDVNDKQENPHA